MNTGSVNDAVFLNVPVLNVPVLNVPGPDSGKAALQQKRNMESGLPLFSTALDKVVHHPSGQQGFDDVLSAASQSFTGNANDKTLFSSDQPDTGMISPLQGSAEVALALSLNTPVSKPLPALAGVPASAQNQRSQGSNAIAQPGIADINRHLMQQLQRYPSTHLAVTRSEQGYTVWIRDFGGQLGSDLDAVVDMITRFLQDNNFPLEGIMLNGRAYALPQPSLAINIHGSRK